MADQMRRTDVRRVLRGSPTTSETAVAQPPQVAAAAPRRSRRLLGSRRPDITLVLLALPGVIFFLVFSYAPMFGAIIAFKDFSPALGILGSPWVGLDNFRFFFTSNDALRVLFNTIFLNMLFIAATTVCSVALAIFVNELRLRIYKRVMQSFLLLPYFMSWVVISMLLKGFIEGIGGQTALLDKALIALHLPTVDWYLTPEVWPVLLTVLRVWQEAGYLSVIYLAALASIPTDVYEAAKIDGASSAKMAWKISVPLITPTMIVLLLLAIGRIFFADFGMIYAIVGDNGVLFPTTDVIDTYVFRALRTGGDLGMTAAVGLFQSAVGLVLVLCANRIARRYSEGSALF